MQQAYCNLLFFSVDFPLKKSVFHRNCTVVVMVVGVCHANSGW